MHYQYDWVKQKATLKSINEFLTLQWQPYVGHVTHHTEGKDSRSSCREERPLNERPELADNTSCAHATDRGNRWEISWLVFCTMDFGKIIG